jgi:hypothetical protein
VKNGPGRSIRYSARFERETAKIDRDVRRMDEALRYVESVLAVDPEFGLPTVEARIRIAPMVFVRGTTSGATAASIFYSYDDEYVDFLSIRVDW